MLDKDYGASKCKTWFSTLMNNVAAVSHRRQKSYLAANALPWIPLSHITDNSFVRRFTVKQPSRSGDEERRLGQ